MSWFLSDFNHNKNIAKSMREVCLFSGTTKPKLSFSKDLDYCQKALYKMDDIDRSSTSHKTPWLKKKKQLWLKICPSYNYLGPSIMQHLGVFV